MKNGPRIAYFTNGEGWWLRREWNEQCSTKICLGGRCQGAKGHRGVHWCYSPSGSFDWDDNAEDPKKDGCSGTTPPGYKSYMSPVKMDKHHYMSIYTDAEVTDAAIIARLEKEKTPEKNAAIDKPVVVKRKGKKLRR